MTPPLPFDRGRRRALQAAGAGAAALAGSASAAGPAARMATRPIPSSGELLPVVGCGTYVGFDQAPGSPGYALLPGVVDALLGAGGKVFDSSPMHGRAEETTGELLAGRRADAPHEPTRTATGDPRP